MLLQILENTDALITGLKNLNSSIKHYIDDLTRYSNVAEIIERLENKSRSKAYIEKAAAELADLQETDIDFARENVYRYLHEIIEAFRNMDEILNEINQKNTQYPKAAINRTMFRLAGHEDVRGQLKEILIGINERVNREQLDLGGIYELEFLEGLIRIYSSGVLEFFRRLPLQILIAAPPDKIQYIGPQMEETLLVMIDERVSYVEEYFNESSAE